LIPERVEQLTHILNDRTIQTPGTTLSRLEKMREILNSNKFANERKMHGLFINTTTYLYFIKETKREHDYQVYY